VATLRVSERVGDLGLYLKEQREQARLSLRELAKAAGVSNPYLSQIERGLRKPSAEVLQQIAKGLRISAEALYLRAGILEESRGLAVEVAIQTDPTLTQRQRRVMLDIYASFQAENERLAPAPTDAGGDMAADASAGIPAEAPPAGAGGATEKPRRAATRRRAPSGAAAPKRSTRRSDAPAAATDHTHRTDGTAATR